MRKRRIIDHDKQLVMSVISTADGRQEGSISVGTTGCRRITDANQFGRGRRFAKGARSHPP